MRFLMIFNHCVKWPFYRILWYILSDLVICNKLDTMQWTGSRESAFKALKLCSASSILSSPLTKNVLMDHCRLPSSRTWRFLAGPHPTTHCSPPVRHSRSVLLIVRRKTSRPFTKISRTLLTSHKIITQITFFSKSDERKFLLGTIFVR